MERKRDIREYARILLKRKWIIALTLIAAIGAAVVLTARTQPTYEARTTLFVGPQQISLTQLQQGYAVQDLSAKLQQSYARILTSRSVSESAVSRSGLPIDPPALAGGLTAVPVEDTQVIELSYRSTDAALSARAVNAVAQAFIDELGRYDAAQEQGNAAVQVSVIDKAVAPGSPIAPNPKENVIFGGILGLLAGVGLAFLFDRLDVSVKSHEDVEELGLPLLGAIPALDTGGAEVYVEHEAQGVGGEAFRKLRTAIGFLGMESPLKTILVTSPVSQEGKTTLALNLATAYALGGFRTLLVEADLRLPSLHRIFGMHGTRGLTTAIVGGVTLPDAVINTETRNLSVILAGAIPPNPVELLGSVQMTDILEQLKRMFDILIIDSPPMVPVADPAALAARCDGVVLVARAGKTDSRRLGESARIIERAGGRLLGVALNFQQAPDGYGYEYSYGYQAAGSRSRGARPEPTSGGTITTRAGT